jgi:hypothetical protein
MEMNMSSQSVRLREFLPEHLDHLQIDGALGADLYHPEFELYARDYLAFAEKELATREERSLINCVAHLKRAIDCQVDSFFSICGLARLFEKRNLKFDKKLEFLEAAGVFTGRTLPRLNTVRNRMEHSYEIPKVADLEAYCDLAAAFIAVLERTVLFLGLHERNFYIAINDDSYEELEGTKIAK